MNAVFPIFNYLTARETWTPLRYAVPHDNIEFAKFLLDHGANKDQKITFNGCFHFNEKSVIEYAISDEMKALISDYKYELK